MNMRTYQETRYNCAQVKTIGSQFLTLFRQVLTIPGLVQLAFQNKCLSVITQSSWNQPAKDVRGIPRQWLGRRDQTRASVRESPQIPGLQTRPNDISPQEPQTIATAAVHVCGAARLQSTRKVQYDVVTLFISWIHFRTRSCK